MRNILDLHPRLQEKLVELQTLCLNNGIYIKIGECLRTVAEQNTLYAQGRTTPGNIVTNAKGTSYSSQHQWGIAADFYLDMDVDGNGNKKDDAFNNTTGLFDRVGQIAKSIGLGWGGDWISPVDKPHLYLPDWGSTTKQLKNEYGIPDNFIKTWRTNQTPTNTTDLSHTNNVSLTNKMDIVRAGQIHTNNFTNADIIADGIRGTKTKKAGIKVLQTALNLDYNANLCVDGIFGAKSKKALGTHYVKYGETQYLVTALEILLMLKGYNPNGVECPGVFGHGLNLTVREYQSDNSLSIDGKAGIKTFVSLIS